MGATIIAWLRWAIEQIGQWWRRPDAPPVGGTTVVGNVTVGRDFVGRDRIGRDEPDEQ